MQPQDFGSPSGALLGVMNASYNLGGLITLPIVPYVNDKLGRKHSITLGSIILLIGVVLQSTSVNGMALPRILLCFKRSCLTV
jgi:MFS family permease